MRRLDLALLAAAVVYASYALAAAPAWTVDDAFIVARYAEHAVSAGRLAWNLEGDRVEGFTSVVAMAIAIAARALGADPIAATKAAGALAYVASGPAIFALARALRAPAPAGGLVALLNASLAEHATHATSGLETELFVLATLVAAWALAGVLATSRRLLPLAIACAAAALVRPEGLSSAALLAVALARRRDRAAVRDVALGFVLPLAIVEAARIAYFHDVVPNTFYAKSGGLDGHHLGSLASLAGELLGAPLACVAAVVAIGRLDGRALPRPDARSRGVLVACGAALAMQVAAYSRASLAMDYGRRFAVHDLGWLLPIAVVAVGLGVAAASSRAAAALLALGAASAGSRGVDRAWTEARRNAEYAEILRAAYRPAGEWVRDHSAPDATLAVYPDAGLVPLLAERRAYDFGRLNDRVLARSNDVATVVRELFARDPDVLVLTEPRPGRLFDEGAEAVVAAPELSRRYRLAARFEAPSGAALRIYERRRP